MTSPNGRRTGAAVSGAFALFWLFLFVLPTDDGPHWLYLAAGVVSAIAAIGNGYYVHREGQRLRGSAPEPPASLRDGGEPR